MSELNEKQARLEAIERQIQRLQRRLNILDSRSNRYGWVRVGIFFGGALLSILAFFLVGWWLFLVGVVISLTLFSVVVYFHRQVTRSITRHNILMHIKATQVARIQLDWARIPAVRSSEARMEHPFEIDLDVSGKRSLHQLLNTAISYDGTQRLHDWLLSTTPGLDIIQKRQALVRELAPLAIFRDKLLMKSILAAHNQEQQWEGKKLLNWLDERRASPSLLPLMLLSLALSTGTLILLALNLFTAFPQYWILGVLLIGIFLYVTRKQRGDLFDDAHYLSDAFGQLSTIFEYLETYGYGKNRHLKELCLPFFIQQEQRPSTLLHRIARIASAATLQKNVLLWLVVNALVPWDFYIAHRFHQYKARIAARLPVWLDIWFELEALNSLATFAYLNPEYVLPEVVASEKQGDRPVFQATGLGHPLIPMEQKVVNDFALPKVGEIAIVTGSNMSGKSTFLRTLGINLCLAYAGGPVNASAFHTSLFRLFTCIKISDSVTDGYSYFYAEVKRLKALLTTLELSEKEKSMPLFFLIDEIFKGTNNRERLIGGESYISALVGRNCLGVVSTHDLELVKLADALPAITNYHFREDVIAGRMVFDYILRAGPSPTTNALKIMQMEGLPVNLRIQDTTK